MAQLNPLLLRIPTEFSSERLSFRSYRPGDGAMYYEMLQANWDHLFEFLPADWLSAHNAEDVESILRSRIAEWNLRNLFLFGIWEKATGIYVGESYLANPNWEVPRLEVGYFIVEASTGKGYATEAARATIRFAFEHMQVGRVELQVAADNPASLRVAERCGLTFEGRFRQRHRKKNGELVDILWYGTLLEEWQSSQAAKPQTNAP
jgi:ribosomal-protein-serine acetyltransferase